MNHPFQMNHSLLQQSDTSICPLRPRLNRRNCARLSISRCWPLNNQTSDAKIRRIAHNLISRFLFPLKTIKQAIYTRPLPIIISVVVHAVPRAQLGNVGRCNDIQRQIE
jgi:hypothetical protein